MALIYELPDQVSLGDVRGLMGHDTGEFVLVSRRQDQAALDRDETSRHRKRVDDGILQYEVVELMLAFLGVARQAMADLLNVIADLRIFEDLSGLANLSEPTQSGPIFVRPDRSSKILRSAIT